MGDKVEVMSYEANAGVSEGDVVAWTKLRAVEVVRRGQISVTCLR